MKTILRTVESLLRYISRLSADEMRDKSAWISEACIVQADIIETELEGVDNVPADEEDDN